VRFGRALIGSLASTLFAAACSQPADTGAAADPKPDAARAAAAERGQKIYENVCIACHNGDPTQPGSLGPQVARASLELLEAKVLRGEYPPAYTPLRPSQAMPKYEYLKDRLGDVAVYLEQD
jgi:mono/diheme cytochrome c family protein